jgi:hypothetical protein
VVLQLPVLAIAVAPFTPPRFSLVFDGRGDPLMMWLSFQHSLACLTHPV